MQVGIDWGLPHGYAHRCREKTTWELAILLKLQIRLGQVCASERLKKPKSAPAPSIEEDVFGKTLHDTVLVWGDIADLSCTGLAEFVQRRAMTNLQLHGNSRARQIRCDPWRSSLPWRGFS